MDAAKRLELFTQRADELRDSRVMQKGLRNGLTVKWSKMEGLRIEANQPDDDELRSFLVPLRKFIMSGEPVFLDSMFNLLYGCLKSDELKERLTEARDAWRTVKQTTGIGLEINGERLVPERIADLWINGRIFHDDEMKGMALEDISKEQLATIFLKHQFLDFVINTTRIILYVAEIVKEGLVQGVFSPERVPVS